MTIREQLINLRFRKLFLTGFKSLCMNSSIVVKSAVFVSNPDFCDNIYPLYIELKKQGYKCLWVLRYKDSEQIAKRLGVKYITRKKNMSNMFKLSKYHYVFYSHEMPYMYDKEGQRYYNCWHGSPFKFYHGVLLNNKTENYFFVPPGVGSMKLYLEHYSGQLCKERCLPYRHFRTDYYLNDFQPEERKKIEQYFKLKNYKKVVLVCLTWIRDKEVYDTTNNLLGFSLGDFDFQQLNKHLKSEEILLVIKPHPGQKVEKSFFYSNIRVVSSFELTNNVFQLYALIGLSDILITDYSSILFDYSLLDKPVGHIIHHWDYFLNNEYEKFIYDDPEEIMYGTKIHSLDELCSFITSPSKNDNEKREFINEQYNADPAMTGSATLRFIKEVIYNENEINQGQN